MQLIDYFCFNLSKLKLFLLSLCIMGTLNVLLIDEAHTFQTVAKSGILIDELTNTVLLNKNVSTPLPPASMSKLMTLLIVFEALKTERISLSDKFRVSKYASKKGGSKMFLREGELVSVENLIRGIIIHSGNDACIVIAEGLSGTEKEFAAEMNIVAKNIGLKNSFFTNTC